MDHPFRTFRNKVEAAREGLSICKTILSVLTISSEDHKRMRERKEATIKDKEKRDAIMLYSSRLGLLVEDLSTKTVKARRIGEIHSKTWTSFLSSRDTNITSLKAEVTALIPTLEDDLAKESITEIDDGSSSCSDYSDSRTSSSSSSSSSSRRRRDRYVSDGESEEEEDDEDEERSTSEEEEKPEAKKTKARK